VESASTSTVFQRDTSLRTRLSAQFVSDPQLGGRFVFGCARPQAGRKRPPWYAGTALVWLGLSMMAGCSGRETFLTGGPTVGQLKTSLSHLEYENQQLKRSVGKLEQENRSIEDRLVQEQLDNGELTAKLDDIRNLGRERGLDLDTRVGSRRDDEGGTARTLPTGQSTRKRRKPPFAVIPGRVEIFPPDEDDTASKPRADGNAKSRRSDLDVDDDLNRHSYRAGGLRWLPVANGSDDSMSQLH
jgi:hypothetical protein